MFVGFHSLTLATGLTGPSDRSNRPTQEALHRAPPRATVRNRVLALDWHQHILATPLGKKDLGYQEPI